MSLLRPHKEPCRDTHIGAENVTRTQVHYHCCELRDAVRSRISASVHEVITFCGQSRAECGTAHPVMLGCYDLVISDQ